MPIFWSLFLMLLLNLGNLGSGQAVSGSGADLENLEYRVSLGPWSEVAVVHLQLARVDQDHYRAEFSGAARGMWRVLSRWLPERYETEMVLEGGRLKPLIFREEFQAKGHHVRKEYHFDYSRKILEMWRSADYQEPVKRWQVPLKEPVYDHLSLFYNFRLGAFGPLKGGENLKVALFPVPESRVLIFRIGSGANENRKIMLELAGTKGEEEAGPYFLVCNSQWVPTEAWTRVSLFGKLAGHLLNPQAIMKDGLLNFSPALTPKPANK